jgi:protein-S-isoprenylcysteine O-methyltransferase Ste14
MIILLYSITYLLWIGSEIYLNRFARSGNIQKKKKDQGSEWILWITAFVAVTASSLIAIYSEFAIYLDLQWSLLGLLCMIAGILFRFTAIRQLGKFFTVDVILHADHQLIQTGLYKSLRHPSYTGIMLTLIGFGWSLNHWMSLLIVVSIFFFALRNRIKIEENALIEQFGEQYLQYKTKSWKLLPFIY